MSCLVCCPHTKNYNMTTENKTYSEKLLEKNLREVVKKLGGIAVKLTAAFLTGWPDRTIIMPGGKIFFAEIKTTGKKLSPRQKIVRAFLEGMGFKYFFIDDKKSLQYCIDYING